MEMTATITSCSNTILALNSILQIVLCREPFTSKWWHSSNLESWNFTIKTFKTCQCNESNIFNMSKTRNKNFTCRNILFRKKQTNARLMDDTFKTRGINIFK